MALISFTGGESKDPEGHEAFASMLQLVPNHTAWSQWLSD